MPIYRFNMIKCSKWLPYRRSLSSIVVLRAQAYFRKDMQLFQSVRKFYANMGFYPSQSHQKRPFNRRIYLILSIFGLTFVCMTSSFLFAATNVTKHAESFFVSLTVLACTIHFLTSFWKAPQVYTFVEKLEKFSEARKLFLWRFDESVYCKSNHLQFFYRVFQW